MTTQTEGKVISFDGQWMVKAGSFTLPSTLDIGIFKGNIIDIAKRLSGVPGMLIFELNDEKLIGDEKFILRTIPPQRKYCAIHIRGMMERDDVGIGKRRTIRLMKALAVKGNPKYSYWNIRLSEEGLIIMEFLR